jgi:16S rRNA (guanine966-N2)-methyltransferase
MRIVAGNHRGRTLQVPPGKDVRPTADRTREALFNILAHAPWSAEQGSPLVGARVIDAFCGSGALGLEALSRGAVACTFIDINPTALEFVRRNIATLDEADRTVALRADVLKLPRARATATLAFLDPPYGLNLAGPALAALVRQGWLVAGAVVVVETDASDPFEPPEAFEPLDQRRYRFTTLHFLRVRVPS